MVSAIGFLAGGLTTLSFVPQVVKTFRSKSCGDVSLGMLLIFGGGVTCWLIYGLALRSWPIIVANAATFALVGTILVMKRIYKPDSHRRSEVSPLKGLGGS